MPKTMSDCLDDIFQTIKIKSTDPTYQAWRLKKMRFYQGKLTLKAKKAILLSFGYEEVAEAQFEQKPKNVK